MNDHFYRHLFWRPAVFFMSWVHDLHREMACRAEARLKDALMFPAEYGPGDIADLKLNAHRALQRADRSLERLEAYKAWEPI